MSLKVVFLTSEVLHHIWIVNGVHREFPVAHVLFQRAHLRRGSAVGLLLGYVKSGRPHLFARRVLSKLLFWNVRRAEGRFEREFFFNGGRARLAPEIPTSFVESFNLASSVAELRRLEADVIVVCGTEFLRPEVLRCARLATVNIHRAILPKYRGGGLPEWNYYMRDFETLGCTIHECAEKLDGGGIYAQRFYRIQKDHAYCQHRAHTTVLAVECLLETLRGLAAGTAKPMLQGPGKTWSARKLTLWKEIVAHWNYWRYVKSL